MTSQKFAKLMPEYRKVVFSAQCCIQYLHTHNTAIHDDIITATYADNPACLSSNYIHSSILQEQLDRLQLWLSK